MKLIVYLIVVELEGTSDQYYRVEAENIIAAVNWIVDNKMGYQYSNIKLVTRLD